jgi:hypothetical protein
VDGDNSLHLFIFKFLDKFLDLLFTIRISGFLEYEKRSCYEKMEAKTLQVGYSRGIEWKLQKTIALEPENSYWNSGNEGHK